MTQVVDAFAIRAGVNDFVNDFDGPEPFRQRRTSQRLGTPNPEPSFLLMTSLSFHGAAGTVTGSRFLLDTGGRKLLIDCGLFQGPKKTRLLNYPC